MDVVDVRGLRWRYPETWRLCLRTARDFGQVKRDGKRLYVNHRAFVEWRDWDARLRAAGCGARKKRDCKPLPRRPSSKAAYLMRWRAYRARQLEAATPHYPIG